jgi:hypothetical protein
MRTNLLSGLILLSGIIFTSFNQANSQVLQVSSAITPEEMVEMLIGSGLEYSNVVFTGADISRGSFWGGPGNIGVSNGIILTSGSMNIAPGPNNSGGAGYNCDAPGDDDLETLANSGSSWDACVLEFDFIPYFELVWFDFVFASEEYHEYVGQFNDAFGFFISGPGISGPFSNNSANIALVPLTNVPIAINNVNCGNPYNCEQSCMNCQFFVNNYEQFTQYDAFTTVLTAWEYVQPNQTYHIKLAIGDMLDHSYDSGVFLQASSFCSGPQTSIGKINQQPAGGNYKVYPIPAGDVLNIASQDGQHFDVNLVGQDGRTFTSASGESQITLDISSLPSGMYFLSITNKDGVSARKIFKN